MDYITSVVQRRCGSDYVLVTADGLVIEDSSGTQGYVSVVSLVAIVQAQNFNCDLPR